MDTSTENLVDSLAIIKQLSYALKKHIDDDDYKEVINSTTQLLGELRHGALSPKDYYEVYILFLINLFLIFVESYICDLLAAGVDGEELYEEVQYTPLFVPRLYLMILVASCCIRMKLIPAKKLIYDTLDMCKGIQHPMRGLFLRNFFIREMKDKFPYPGCRYETPEGGDVKDSVECILRNFVEMNRLWIRMQNGKSRNLEQREQQRKDLKVLVGTNFVVLSQLEGIDAEYYSKEILHRIINEINSCNDPIAQEYLMESLIQVFPDDYHLAGLSQMLECLSHLNSSLDIKMLMNELFERIRGSEESVSEDVYYEIIRSVNAMIKDSVDNQAFLPIRSLLMIEDCVFSFMLKSNHDCLNELNELYGLSIKYLVRETSGVENAADDLVSFLTQPLERYGVKLLTLSNYIPLLNVLKSHDAVMVATKIASFFVSKRPAFEKEEARVFLQTIGCLSESDEIPNLHLLARAIQLIDLPDSELIEVLLDIEKTIVGNGSLNAQIPVIAIVYILLRRCSIASEPAPFFEVLEKMMNDLRTLHIQQAMIATMDLILTADRKNVNDKVKEYIEDGITVMKGLKGKYYVAYHAGLIRTLMSVTCLSQEELKEYTDELESQEAVESEIELKNKISLQCAVLYSSSSETNGVADMEKAKQMIDNCKTTIEKSALNTKERMKAKAILLGDLARTRPYCPTIVTEESLKTMYTQLIREEKLSRETKRILESVKPLLAL